VSKPEFDYGGKTAEEEVEGQRVVIALGCLGFLFAVVAGIIILVVILT